MTGALTVSSRPAPPFGSRRRELVRVMCCVDGAEAQHIHELQSPEVRMCEVFRLPRCAELFFHSPGIGVKPLEDRGLIERYRAGPHLPRSARTRRNSARSKDARKKNQAQRNAVPPPGAQAHGRTSRELLKELLVGENHVFRNLRGRPFVRRGRERPSTRIDGAREHRESLDRGKMLFLKPLPETGSFALHHFVLSQLTDNSLAWIDSMR